MTTLMEDLRILGVGLLREAAVGMRSYAASLDKAQMAVPAPKPVPVIHDEKWDRRLSREVEKVDAETPHEVQERLIKLPEAGEARQLLQKLERMRTDVLHAQNAIEGIPKQRESFAVRLRRMNKQGKIPDEIFKQVLVVSRFRNRAVYESYHLQSDEVETVDKAFDAIGKWTHKVGYIY